MSFEPALPVLRMNRPAGDSQAAPPPPQNQSTCWSATNS